MNENQRTHFDRMASLQDSTQRSWAKNYQAEQRKAYGINTQNSVIEGNKAMLAANIHDDNFANDAIAQIGAASRELSYLQGLDEQESKDLEQNNIISALTPALQGKVEGLSTIHCA